MHSMGWRPEKRVDIADVPWAKMLLKYSWIKYDTLQGSLNGYSLQRKPGVVWIFIITRLRLL
jgi:hypothetical protein